MRILAIICVLLVTGCAYNPEKGEQAGREESARMETTTKPLSSFKHYDVKPMAMVAEISGDEKKLAEAKLLDEKFQAMMSELIKEWSADDKSGKAGTLVIQPSLERLRVVSGGARFFVGVFAGGSEIEMDLILTDGVSGSSVGKPRINRESGAWAGAWTFGKADDNLLDYIVEISHQYLLKNY